MTAQVILIAQNVTCERLTTALCRYDVMILACCKPGLRYKFAVFDKPNQSQLKHE